MSAAADLRYVGGRDEYYEGQRAWRFAGRVPARHLRVCSVFTRRIGISIVKVLSLEKGTEKAEISFCPAYFYNTEAISLTFMYSSLLKQVCFIVNIHSLNR